MYFIEDYHSPLGAMTMVCNDNALCGLWFDGQRHYGENIDFQQCEKCHTAVFDLTKRWLDAYFEGLKPGTPPPLMLAGSVFRMRVWKALCDISFGETVAYGSVAQRMMEDYDIQCVSSRAVGGAVGRNPIAIIVPCHRVVGAGFNASLLEEENDLEKMKLTGYAAGIERKLWLLRWERKIVEMD